MNTELQNDLPVFIIPDQIITPFSKNSFIDARSELRKSWNNQLKQTIDYDHWGQIIEACDGYIK
jgi:hypothetical protein